MRSCRICGSVFNLTEHHIHPRSFAESYINGPDKVNEAANKVLLCRGCHDCVHDRKPLYLIIREVKQKIRRPFKPRKFSTAEQLRQSIKDRAKQLQSYKHILDVLNNPYMRLQIEGYRRKIAIITIMHKHVKRKIAGGA